MNDERTSTQKKCKSACGGYIYAALLALDRDHGRLVHLLTPHLDFRSVISLLGASKDLRAVQGVEVDRFHAIRYSETADAAWATQFAQKFSGRFTIVGFTVSGTSQHSFDELTMLPGLRHATFSRSRRDASVPITSLAVLHHLAAPTLQTLRLVEGAGWHVHDVRDVGPEPTPFMQPSVEPTEPAHNAAARLSDCADHSSCRLPRACTLGVALRPEGYLPIRTGRSHPVCVPGVAPPEALRAAGGG